MFFANTNILIGDNFSFYKYLTIFFISLFSNIFSSIAGGGAGLLQLPLLILVGTPYYQALATHKIATVALGLGGSLRNHKSLRNNLDIAGTILIFGIPGVICGSSIVRFLPRKFYT